MPQMPDEAALTNGTAKPMTDLPKLAELRKLLQSMERALGLEQLSPVERDIYYAASELSRQDEQVRTLVLIEHELLSGVSRPTFFRALKSRVNKGYLAQSASANRGRYVVNDPSA